MTRPRGGARGAVTTRGRQGARSRMASVNEGRLNPRAQVTSVEEGRQVSGARLRGGTSRARGARATRGRGRGRAEIQESTTPEFVRTMPEEEVHQPSSEQGTFVEERHPAVGRQEVPADDRREWMATMMEMMGNTRRGSSITFGEFVRTNPPTFEGAYNPLAAQAWLENIEKVLDAMCCTDRERVQLAAYQLRGRADVWWKMIKRTYDEEAITWEVFKSLFYEKYFPESLRDQKKMEFMQLTQGGMTVGQYEVKFTDLSRFAPQLISTETDRAKEFLKGLKREIRVPLSILPVTTYAESVNRALKLEAEMGMDRDYGTNKRPESSRSRDFVPNKRAHTGNEARAPFQAQYRAPFQAQYQPLYQASMPAPFRGPHQTPFRAPPQVSQSSFQPCGTCGKMHQGACRQGIRGCFHCGQEGHRFNECPIRKGKQVAPQGQQYGPPRAPAPQGRGQGAPRPTGRVFTFTAQDAQASNDVVTGTPSN